MPLTLQNAELVGRGFTADIYAWGAGRVLKLFHPRAAGGEGAERAAREFRVTCAVHSAGLPVPAAYELVTVENRHGIVFQRIDGVSMLRHFQKTPWKFLSAARQLADLHTQIHRCECPVELPSQRERIAAGIERAKHLSAEQKQAAHVQLAELPDGSALCHGDFHPENILFTARGPVVIDWGSASRGDPLGDVACTSRLIQNAYLPPWTPWYMHLILRTSRGMIHRAYLKRALKLHGATREQVQAWANPVEAAAAYWRALRA